MRRRLVVTMTLVCLAGLLSSNSARAAAGALDPTFGIGGKVLTRLKNCGLSICNAQPADAVLQPDAKIVVAINFLGFEFGAIRYMPNGTIDQTFGTRGLATVAFANNDLTTVYGAALQSDGKIIVAGNVENPTSDAFALIRLEPNGSLDTGFGSGGRVTTPLGFPGVGQAVLIQTDGKILMGATILTGHLGIPQTALARYNPDGSLDPTFANGGTETLPATGGVSALAELSDGDIIVVNHSAIAQFNSAGTLESTVTSGTVDVSAPGGVFLSDGHYFDPTTVAVGSPRSHLTDAQVFEFNPTGNADSAFNNPMFVYSAGNSNSATASGFQNDGKLVVSGGHCGAGFNPCVFGVARLNTDGSLDSSFGTAGTVTTQFTGEDFGGIVLSRSDGDILDVGQSIDHNTGQANIAMAQYLAQ
jgi:uncharacterized delta-60 repeat protein